MEYIKIGNKKMIKGSNGIIVEDKPVKKTKEKAKNGVVKETIPTTTEHTEPTRIQD